jgi:hypothetical protein
MKPLVLSWTPTKPDQGVGGCLPKNDSFDSQQRIRNREQFHDQFQLSSFEVSKPLIVMAVACLLAASLSHCLCRPILLYSAEAPEQTE